DGPDGVPVASLAVVRANELYVGLYRRSGRSVEPLAHEQALPLDAVIALLRSRPELHLLGPAMADYREALVDGGVGPDRFLPGHLFPSAVAVATLAQFPDAWTVEQAFGLEPHYLRPLD